MLVSCLVLMTVGIKLFGINIILFQTNKVILFGKCWFQVLVNQGIIRMKELLH